MMRQNQSVARDMRVDIENEGKVQNEIKARGQNSKRDGGALRNEKREALWAM